MKKLIVLFIVIAFSVVHAFGKEIKAYYYNCRYDIPGEKPYIETYLAILGNSLEFAPSQDGKFSASVEITIVFSQEDKVKNFKKYVLKSPEISDTTTEKPNFIDLQRFNLENGVYNIEVSLRDMNADSSSFILNDLVTINFDQKGILFSDLMFVEEFEASKEQNILTKSGFDLTPYVSDFYPENISKLIFYTEIYNTDSIFPSEESFLVNYSIRSYRSKKIYGDFGRFQKKTPASVIPIIGEFDITELPSGNYFIVLEVRDKKNEVIESKEIFFQRSNPKVQFSIEDYISFNSTNSFASGILNAEELQEYIACLSPISNDREVIYAKNVTEKGDLTQMQNYFYNFWVRKNSSEPEKEWIMYYDKVKLVNKSYTTQIKKGYETDKGRVYLQYGPPNHITEEKHDPHNYPYEIWQYYSIDNQKDVSFVFYNPFLAGNEYLLLHSNARGEIREENWESVLNKRTNPTYDFDSHRYSPSNQHKIGGYGDKKGEIFND